MEFTKMQATGNDFIVIDARKLKYDWNKLAKEMCDRHFGVGADGLIIIESINDSLFMRIFNADGSEAEVCGNGLRCFAKYVIDNGIVKGKKVTVKTSAGDKIVEAYLYDGKVKNVKVNMGMPVFEATSIPVNISQKDLIKYRLNSELITDYPLKINNNHLNLSFVSIGNPHAIHFINEDIHEFPLDKIGPFVENNKIFPRRINFEIAHIIDNKKIEVRVWERGVGETLACGSGACAVAVVAIEKNLANNKVDIIMPGGVLNIEWKRNDSVYLTGDVNTVFSGRWH